MSNLFSEDREQEYEMSDEEIIDSINNVQLDDDVPYKTPAFDSPEGSESWYMSDEEIVDSINDVDLEEHQTDVSAYDYLKRLAIGTGEMAKTAGKILSVPDTLKRMVVERVGEIAGTEVKTVPTGKELVGKKITEFGKTAAKFYEEKLSPAMKREKKKTILAGPDDEGVFADDISFHQIAGMITESAPASVVGMGISIGITKALIGTGLSILPKVVARPMIKLFGESAAAGIVGGAIGEGSVAAAMNADNTYEEINATPTEVIRKSKAYQYISNKLSYIEDPVERHAEAKQRLAMAGAAFVGIISGASTALLGAPSGAIMGRIIGGESKSLWKNVLSEALTEGLIEENLQSGAERIIENVAIKHLTDPRRKYMEGVFEAMASGAVSGFFMGGGMAGGATLLTKAKGTEELTEKDVVAAKPKPGKKIDNIMKGIRKAYSEGVVSTSDLGLIKDDLLERIKREPASKAVRENQIEEIDALIKERKMHDGEFKGAEEEALRAWQSEPKQKVVAKELADFGKLIFGESFIGTKIRPVPETEANAPGLQKIAKKLNFGEVVFYDPAGTDFNYVNGFYDTVTNKIFLNKNSERPLLIVMGHESLHKLKENAPDLYKKLDKVLKGKELNFDKYMKKLNSSRKAGGLPTLDTAETREEFIADFVGEAMAKPTFWKKLNAEDPGLAKKLAEIVIELVKRIRKAAASGFADPQGPWKYFKDLDAVEAEAGKIYAQYAKKVGKAPKLQKTTEAKKGPVDEKIIKLALKKDVKYTTKYKIGGKPVEVSAGETLTELSEQREIMRKIINCA